MTDYIEFGLISVVGAALGLLVYRPGKNERRLQFSYRVGMALAGASMGVFGGLLILPALDAVDSFPKRMVVETLMATLLAIAFQRTFAEWIGDPRDEDGPKFW